MLKLENIVAGYGHITALKDMLWRELNADGEYKKSFESITHRNLDIKVVEFDDDDESIPEDDYEEEDWDEEEDEDFDPDFYYGEDTEEENK